MVALAACVCVVSTARAQASGDPLASGLVAGDYLRIGGGITSPVNAQGSLKDWSTGPGFSIAYENWASGGNGVGRVGFGVGAAYSFLPFKDDVFINGFIPANGVTTRSATASSAGILEITSNLRIRFPMPVVMPSVNVGFGFINWAPGTIHYVASDNSTGTVKQSHRSGAELSIGAGLDRQLWDRYALYVDGAYVYGYTSYGQGFATPGGVCASTGCDPLKNTTVATLRGGLRVRLGQ